MTPDPGERLIFLHLPKTAGVNVRGLLSREYRHLPTFISGAPGHLLLFQMRLRDREAFRVVGGHYLRSGVRVSLGIADRRVRRAVSVPKFPQIAPEAQDGRTMSGEVEPSPCVQTANARGPFGISAEPRRDQRLRVAFPGDGIGRGPPELRLGKLPSTEAQRRQFERGGRRGLFRARRCK